MWLRRRTNPIDGACQCLKASPVDRLAQLQPLSDPMACHQPYHAVASRCSSLRVRHIVGWRVYHTGKHRRSVCDGASMLRRFSVMGPVASSRLSRIPSSELRAYRNYHHHYLPFSDPALRRTCIAHAVCSRSRDSVPANAALSRYATVPGI